jgi:NNP family nitrate/nitrite transporter-like MFS transporter
MNNIQKVQLPLQTASLIVGFMVWVIISSLMPFIKEDILLSPGEIALVTAVPVILGSIFRIPLGYFTNRYGARNIFFISFVLLLIPIYYVSVADSFMDLLLGGLFIGLGGAVFSIGVTSLPKYYPKERHGFVNGIYGAGNIGTAVTAFSAPVLASYLGWTATVKLYLVLVAAFALLNFLLGDRKESKLMTPLMEQIKSVYRNEKMWAFSLFYFITFGSFVAFTVYLPNFLVSHFGLDKVDAGLRTAGFIALATAMRPLGGWLADRFNPYKILLFVFGGLTSAAVLLSFSPSIGMYSVGCLSIAMCAGLGNGTIFKLVPLYFTKQAGIVNGIVSAIGGLGGFFPPLLLMAVFGMTGHYAIGFMALAQLALASLVVVLWMFYQEKLQLSTKIIQSTAQAIMVTDQKGRIKSANPSFTSITGYQLSEVLGKKPSILKSGRHNREFYQRMWEQIEAKGYWQGEVWNKKKNGEIYLEWLTISAIRNDGGEIKYYTGMFSDLSQHIRYDKKDA